MPAKNTADGIRAVSGTQVIDPDSVQRYMEGKFGDNLAKVTSAMKRLAKAGVPKASWTWG